MPPMMPVPIEWRAFAPAPTARASGRQPTAKASEVMMIGRRRCSPASRVASMIECPCARNSTAAVTRSTAFFAPRPISTSRPIWKYTSFSSPRTSSSASAPSTPKGMAVITAPGSVHDSYCAASTRKTTIRPNTKASDEVPPDCFSSKARPDQAKL